LPSWIENLVGESFIVLKLKEKGFERKIKRQRFGRLPRRKQANHSSA